MGMRISILVSTESQNLIQQILASQSLATQASVARQAFALGLRALAGAPSPTAQHPDALRAAEKEARLARIKAEWGTDDVAAAEHDLAVLQEAHDGAQSAELPAPSLPMLPGLEQEIREMLPESIRHRALIDETPWHNAPKSWSRRVLFRVRWTDDDGLSYQVTRRCPPNMLTSAIYGIVREVAAVLEAQQPALPIDTVVPAQEPQPHPEDEHLTPSLSPDDDEPTLASTPAAIASQPPPPNPISDEQYDTVIAPLLEVPDERAPSEQTELDAFLEALS